MKQDTILRGKPIAQGQMVFQMLMSANRDPGDLRESGPL